MHRLALTLSCALLVTAPAVAQEGASAAQPDAARADGAPVEADRLVDADEAEDDVAAPAPAEPAQPTVLRRFALVAGVNLGGHGRSPLRYAVSDAQEVARVFQDLGGVMPEDLELLENPDSATLLGALGGMAPRMRATQGERVELVVYYSGHSDEAGLLLGEERLGYRELKQNVDALPADVRIIVLDSCSSGALTRLKGGVRRAPFLVDASSAVKGHAFLTSASADEAAQESDRIGGSFFTHYLVSGLRGAADATGDGRVTLSEAYQFAFHETLKRTEASAAGPQHANYDIRLAGSGDLVMTDLGRGTAELWLAPDLRGRVFVRRPEGSLVAEVRKAEQVVTRLSLPPGPYDVRLENSDGVWGTTVALTHGAGHTVLREHFEKLALEPTVSRGVPFEMADERARVFEATRLKENGETMLYGGIATAATGACCTAMAAPATIITVLAASDGGLQGAAPCIATAGTCTVLGVLFAAFGVPVAWTGMSRIGDADAVLGDGDAAEGAEPKEPKPPAAKATAKLSPPAVAY